MIVNMIEKFDTAGYLHSIGSGLADVTFKHDGMNFTAGSFIDFVATAFRIRQQYILTVLQAEQGLVKDKITYSPAYSVSRLAYNGIEKPDLGAGVKAVRNTFILPNGVKEKGWLKVTGEWKMVACVGMGIPDPGITPPWDCTPFIGFDNQLWYLGKKTNQWIADWYSGKRQVTLYGGENIVTNTPDDYVLLQWTPSPSVLEERPKIHKQLFGEA